MPYQFDIISDTFIESWPDLDLSMIATSPYCIFAGGAGHDRNTVVDFLVDLQQCYDTVFYIDGDDEHIVELPHSIDDSYEDLLSSLGESDDLVYLQNHVVIANQIAIVGTNGWWDFAFDPYVDPQQAKQWWCAENHLGPEHASEVRELALADATYLINTLERLHSMDQVEKIIVVTHTVPLYELIEHDPDVTESMNSSIMGNSVFKSLIKQAPVEKVDTWIFGQYGGDIDTVKHGIRFVNNCRNQRTSRHAKSVYHPKRIVVTL